MIRLTNLKLSIDDGDILAAVSHTLKISPDKILAVDTVKRAIDARYGSINFVYTVDVKTSADEIRIVSKIKNAEFSPEREKWELISGTETIKQRPIIVGAGPAGLFAAYALAEKGFKPIILERGKKVEERKKDIDEFFLKGGLDEESNICFGEGGAGTYSDGKLKTRISDPRSFYVLKKLKDNGAPGSILYDSNPHIGTDILEVVIANIRKKIESLGGTFYFETKLVFLEIKDEKIVSAVTSAEKLDAQTVILATGHSARDTYEMLSEAGVSIKQKTFAMGLRIEHPREVIDRARYHEFAGHKKLGAASYSLNADTKAGKAYTFCMCPGGVVVNSSSEEGMLCVNGMSRFRRDGENSNSAVVSQITPEMTETSHPLGGIYYQRKYEKLAYELGGGGYKVPAMRVCDFLAGSKPKAFEVMPTVMPKAVPADISKALPENLYHTLKAAIPEMGKKLAGFDMGGAVLSAIESRTSSPVRIMRGEDMQSVNTKGLYPVGEGAGYAGGIVSSAVDGLKAAEEIIKRYKPK